MRVNELFAKVMSEAHPKGAVGMLINGHYMCIVINYMSNCVLKLYEFTPEQS